MAGKATTTVNILRSAYVGPDGMGQFLYKRERPHDRANQKDGSPSLNFDRGKDGQTVFAA